MLKTANKDSAALDGTLTIWECICQCSSLVPIPPVQYPGTPIAIDLAIRRPNATTQLHGPPEFVVDVVLAIAALVQLKELQKQGLGDCV